MKTKTLLLVLVCIGFYRLSAQENSTIIFEYDQGGNIRQRHIEVLPQARIGKIPSAKDSVYAFNIYPNPTNQILNIEGELPEGKREAELTLFNATGQIVKTGKYTGKSKTLPVSDLKPGIYVLEIRYSKTNSSAHKIIISN